MSKKLNKNAVKSGTSPKTAKQMDQGQRPEIEPSHPR
jgi:hypothetical protein